jgi:glyoxylate/hydroxypyruvate reductase A
MLPRIRVLVCMLPLTAETTGILNKVTMSKLPKGSVVINVGRGQHLVEDDLVELLSSGHISAACLDTTTIEPLPQHHKLWVTPNVTITPHIAAVVVIPVAARQIADKIHALEQGQSVSGLVVSAGDTRDGRGWRLNAVYSAHIILNGLDFIKCYSLLLRI